MVVVVVSDIVGTNPPWIITVYMARKLKEGEIEWLRS